MVTIEDLVWNKSYLSQRRLLLLLQLTLGPTSRKEVPKLGFVSTRRSLRENRRWQRVGRSARWYDQLICIREIRGCQAGIQIANLKMQNKKIRFIGAVA